MYESHHFFQETIAVKVERKARDRTQIGRRGVEKKVQDKGVFANGIAVGLGMAYIAAFSILWMSVYFSPKLPAGINYQDLLSLFFGPLIILLAIGIASLTTGIVRQYSGKKHT